MAGKFTNTQYADSIDKLTGFHKELLNNDFYMFTSGDQRPSKCTYYNINKEKSTYDGGSKLIYDEIGSESPLRFDRINDLYIYGMQRLEINLENEEFGMESNPLTGESYILPDQFIPTDNDFFTIDHVDHKWLFKVTDASMAFLQEGTQAWKISWMLDRTSDQDILKNVVRDFKYVETNIGTQTKRIVLSTNYELAKEIDQKATSMRNYFRDLFYSPKIQSFCYKWYNEYIMYDPYAIEFILRNKLLIGAGSDYIHVEHISNLLNTFTISYDRSVFRIFELKDISKFREYSYQAQADYIDDPTTIFGQRYEQYFQLNYDIIRYTPNGPFNPRGIIPVMMEQLIERIQKKWYFTEEYPEDREHMYLNIVIKYFNNEDITLQDLNYFDRIDYCPSERLFYDMLFVIFCMDYYTNKLLN